MSFLTDDGQIPGAVLKEVGMALADANTDEWWKDCADRGILELAARSYREGGTEFISFDLIGLGVPDPDSPKRWGPRMLAAARAGLIERVRIDNGKRSSSHSAPVSYWRGTALAAAIAAGSEAA